MLLVQNVLTAWLDISKSRCQIIAIPGVIKLLYQDYAHIPWKHNVIYDSVYIKHGGWQFQKLQYILSLCWWPAVNKAVSLWSEHKVCKVAFRTPCTGKSNCWWEKPRDSNVKYTGCPRSNVPNFGRVFLRLKYTDITQNTYIQSWTVTEIMAGEVWNFDCCYTLID